MFCPEGYVSMAEVTNAIFRRTQSLLGDWQTYDNYPEEIVEKEDRERFFKDWTWAVTLLFSWHFCRKADFVGVVTAQGQIVRASSALLLCAADGAIDDNGDDYREDGQWVSISVGTVGSGKCFRGFPTKKISNEELHLLPFLDSNEVQLKLRFGPFLFCPVVFKSEHFAEYLRKSSEAGESETEAIHAMDSIASSIMRRRGRPKKGDGAVEIALQREFQRRRDASDLALDQLESVYAAAAEWVQHIFGHDLPRSSAQRWLAEILKE